MAGPGSFYPWSNCTPWVYLELTKTQRGGCKIHGPFRKQIETWGSLKSEHPGEEPRVFQNDVFAPCLASRSERFFQPRLARLSSPWSCKDRWNCPT